MIDEIEDPVERATKFDAETERELRPIFAASLNEDKQGIKRAIAVFEGKNLEKTDGLKKWLKAAFGDAINSAAGEQLHVLRGAMRTFNLLEKPGAFLKDKKIKWTVIKYFFRGRTKNSKARLQRGPNREQMLEIALPKETQKAA